METSRSAVMMAARCVQRTIPGDAPWIKFRQPELFGLSIFVCCLLKRKLSHDKTEWFRRKGSRS